MTKERRLGRGLAALLGTPLDSPQQEPEAVIPASEREPDAGLPANDFLASDLLDEPAKGETSTSDTLQLNVYEIDDNPFQPRREFNESEIASLAESLKEHDMLQPILVRKLGERFQLISGERRLRAAVRAGWSTVPARIREADDRLVAELAIVENLQRKDLNAIEKALSFKRYLQEHDCKQEDLANRIKIDRSTIANLMRLLELPPTVVDAVRAGDISAGHARALLPLGDEEEQVEYCQRIRESGLSVRAIERQVQERISSADQIEGTVSFEAEKRAAKRTQSDQIASLEQELKTALGTRVEIRQSSRGRGKMVVHFANHDEFERIRSILTHDGSPQRRAA